MYALPRGGKPIVGPSIRLAEIIAGQWGNNRVAARVVDVNRTEKYVEAEGVFHDLETNSATKALVRRRIVDKYGKLYNDDMIVVTGNAACSVARRNAILAGVPKAVWRRAYEAAEQAVKGEIKTLAERRGAMFKAFAAFGIKPEQIFALLEVEGEEDINLDHIPVLIGMHQGLKSGELTVEQLFDARKVGSTHRVVSDPLSDKAPDEAGKAEPEKKSAVKPRGHSARTGEADHVEGTDGETLKSKDDPPADTAADTGADGAGPDEADKGEPLTPAYLAGKKARTEGVSKRAIPGEYRADEAEEQRTDWLAGWDDADAEAKAGAAK